MNSSSILLKLFLEGLGVGFNVSNLDSRILTQKAVYLGQLSGFDLGYRFGWYIRGPYSPALTRDYFTLDNQLNSEDREFENKKLMNNFRDMLERIKGILQVPREINISQPKWAELLASVHFLLKRSRYDLEKVKIFLAREKPELSPHIDSAYMALSDYSLV